MLLTSGLVLACAISLVGGVMLLVQGHGEVVEFKSFEAEPTAMRSIGGIWSGATSLDGGSIALLGALVLVATPIARVALAMVAFLLEGDRLYVVIAAIVLALLLTSLLLGV
ncbi:MAG: DUF1634 domain-containing protein [Phycisphaeraceae bacterium]|nr:DUF1634 domain-containing protein [Phycisphaeraceae bacterium]